MIWFHVELNCAVDGGNGFGMRSMEVGVPIVTWELRFAARRAA